MSYYFQRARSNMAQIIPKGDKVSFDLAVHCSESLILEENTPVIKPDFSYNNDGSINLYHPSTYVIIWTVAPATGLGTDGQAFELKQRNYDAELLSESAEEIWEPISHTTSHLKLAASNGQTLLIVSESHIQNHQMATIALFNRSNQDISLTPHPHDKATLLIFDLEHPDGTSTVGITGATGADGPTGPSGATGPAGMVLNIKDGIWDLSELPEFSSTLIGDAYVVLDAFGQYNLYYNGENGSDWTVILSWGGVQGATGESGPTGATGPEPDMSEYISRLEELYTFTFDTDYHDHIVANFTPELNAMLVGHLRTGYNHVYFGHGEITGNVTLRTSNSPYILIGPGGCASLTNLYQGGKTTVSAWITSGVNRIQFPVDIDNNGIRMIVPNNLNNTVVERYSTFNFQSNLVLIPPATP